MEHYTNVHTRWLLSLTLSLVTARLPVSKQLDVIKLEVDSLSEEKAVPFPSNSHPTALDTLYVGGTSIIQTHDLKRKYMGIIYVYFPFHPFRNGEGDLGLCVFTLCGLLEKREA